MEALDKLSVVGKTEEFKQSVHVASELRNSILASLKIVAAEPSGQYSGTIKSEQVLLVQQLQSALSALEVLVLDNAPEFAPVIGDQALQRMAEVVTQLHDDLSTVIVIGEVPLLQTDIANCKSEREILKESLMNETALMVGQEGKQSIVHESIVFENDEVLEETAEKTVEAIASLAPKREKIIVLETESQLKDNSKENTEQVVSEESTNSTGIVETKEPGHETIYAECVAAGKIGIMALDSEILVPTETLVAAEQQIATDETKKVVDDKDKVEEIDVVLKKEDILQESELKLHEASTNKVASKIVSEDEVKDSPKSNNMAEVPATTTGNFVFYSYRLILIK